MKRIRILLVAVTLLIPGSFTGVVFAQERNKPDQEKEDMKKAIEEQKKAMIEQQIEQEKAQMDINKSLMELEKLKDLDFDLDVDVDEIGNNVRVYRRGNRSLDSRSPAFIPTPPDAPMVFGYGSHAFIGGSESNRASWEFSKSVKENSFKKEYSFDVEKTVKSVVMSVSGDCKSGEIKIKILTPQGKTYSDVVIDEFGNLNVRKSFNISETENQDKTGEWKFQINSDNATGYFRISFQTY